MATRGPGGVVFGGEAGLAGGSHPSGVGHARKHYIVALAQDRSAYLVDVAKADALRTPGETNAAADLMAKYVQPD